MSVSLQKGSGYKKNTPNRYLSRDQFSAKMLDTAKELKTVKATNKKLRKRIRMVELSESSHESIKAIFEKVDAKDIPSDMNDLWSSQKKYLKLNDKRGMRWPHR